MTDDQHPLPWMGKVSVAAVVIGVLVWFGCILWEDDSGTERARLSGINVQRAIDGQEPLSYPAAPWPARHPILSGILAAAVVVVVGRVIEWGRNVEAAAQALRNRRE